MKNIPRLFLDTNIMLDYLMAREPFASDAVQVLELGSKKQIVLGISALSISNIFYIIRHTTQSKEAYRTIATLMKYLTCIDLTSEILQKALKLQSPDFEDATQYFSALAFKADAIITRDPTGFSFSKLSLYSAKEWLNQL